MANRIEVAHTEFLQMIMGKRAKRLGYGTWQTPGAEVIREAAGTQSARIYIEQRHATLAKWVGIHPLFEVCVRQTGYRGGGRKIKAWWRQEATEKHLRDTLEDSQEAKRRRRSGGEMGMQQDRNRKGEAVWVVNLYAGTETSDALVGK